MTKHEKSKWCFKRKTMSPNPKLSEGCFIKFLSDHCCFTMIQYIKHGCYPSFSLIDSVLNHNFGQNLTLYTKCWYDRDK